MARARVCTREDRGAPQETTDPPGDFAGDGLSGDTEKERERVRSAVDTGTNGLGPSHETRIGGVSRTIQRGEGISLSDDMGRGV